MPGLARKLAIIAAVDGLILQPLAQRNQRNFSAIQIDYKTHHIGPIEQDSYDQKQSYASFEAHGIVGKPRLPRAHT